MGSFALIVQELERDYEIIQAPCMDPLRVVVSQIAFVFMRSKGERLGNFCECVMGTHFTRNDSGAESDFAELAQKSRSHVYLNFLMDEWKPSVKLPPMCHIHVS